jgi:hypothetical protein
MAPPSTAVDYEISAAIAVIRRRFDITFEQAFAAMLASSRRTGRSLSDLAIAVVHTARREASANARERRFWGSSVIGWRRGR